MAETTSITNNNNNSPDWSKWEFVKAEKKIHTTEDFEKWKKSQTFQYYEKFINDLSDSVKGIQNSSDCVISPVSKL